MDARNTPPEPPNPPPAGSETPAGGGPAPHLSRYGTRAGGRYRRTGNELGAQPAERLPVGQALERLAEQSAVYATRAFGPGTQRAYRSAWGK